MRVTPLQLLTDFDQTPPQILRKIETIDAARVLAARMGKKINGRRLTTQKSFFSNVAAKDAVRENFPELLTADPELQFEYCHLIAYGHIGEAAAQNKENLIIGTDHCNTMMMFLEFIIENLATQGHTITSEVIALLDTNYDQGAEFHLAKLITYKVTIDNKYLVTFEFDPQLITRPPYGMHRYFWACIDAAMQQCHDSQAIQ